MGRWDRFLTNPVRVVAITTTDDTSGDDVRPDVATLISSDAGTAYSASVQQGSATLAANLATDAAIQAGAAVGTVFFGSEPVDASSSRADKRLRSRDLILWATPSGEVRVLSVLGPVRDEGGAGVGWSADYEEVA